jgi:hypothetical protein
LRVIIFDPVSNEFHGGEREVEKITPVDGMYCRELDLMPLAYIYLAEHKEKLLGISRELAAKKAEYDAFTGNIFYRVLPQYRAR